MLNKFGPSKLRDIFVFWGFSVSGFNSRNFKMPIAKQSKTPNPKNTKTHIMKNKGLLLLLGFVLFILGITSIIMSLVGVRWVFLGWLEWGGALLAFVLKIIMSISGVLLIIFARTDWEQEKKESSEP